MFVTENKHTLLIELNREFVYKDIGHGAVFLTKDDVECTVNLDGEIHEGIITYDMTTVLVKEISIEVREENVVNLDNNQELSPS